MSTGRGETKENIVSKTKNISNILSESVALNREKIKSYQFVNKAFPLSFLPILDS